MNKLDGVLEEVRRMRMESREKFIRQERDLPQFTKRLIYNYVDEFVSENPHITQKQLLTEMKNVMVSNIRDRYGFLPSPIEFGIVVSDYFKNKETEDLPF